MTIIFILYGYSGHGRGDIGQGRHVQARDHVLRGRGRVGDEAVGLVEAERAGGLLAGGQHRGLHVEGRAGRLLTAVERSARVFVCV